MNPQSEGRRELDMLVINIKLTLASIIQGVALFFLSGQRSRGFYDATLGFVSVYRRRIVRDLYLLVTVNHSHAHADSLADGIWAQLLLHRVRVARGDSFSRLHDPLAWFQLSAIYTAVVWLFFVYDLRLIHARIEESRNDADRALYARALADQLVNIRVLVLCFFS